MKNIIKIIGLLLCIGNLSLNVTAREDGDVVGFIGDSITHARYCDISYIEILNQYYLCRFPERKTELRNLGVAGYKACDILDIYDIDPGFQGINKAVIMLGTNEAILKYSPEKYINDMDKLINRLKTDGLAGEDILLLTPPVCEEINASSSLFKIEATLLKYMEALEAKVPEWGVHYLDIHTPMAELAEEIRLENPEKALTIDGIHPNTAGQMLIAYYLLQAQDAGNVVPIAEASAASQTENNTFCRTQKGMFGTFVPETLPWAATEELLEFLDFYKPAGMLYQELLKVDGFSEKIFYQIFVNETELGTFTGSELAEGVNLAALPSHPFQAQVQQLAKLNQQWHKTTVSYRDIWIDVMMQRATYTKEQAQAKYEIWHKKEDALREEMYTLAHRSVGNPCSLVIVEAGYPVAQLEQDYLEEQERAQQEAMEQARREEEARIQKEAEAKAQRDAAIAAQREAELKAREHAEREAAKAAIAKLCLIAFIVIAIAATLSLPLILSRKNNNTDTSQKAG